MARRRFFVDQVRKGQAEITGDNAHHLTRVLRVEVGQKFEITDNQRAWLASVETARKDLVRFNVIEELAAGPELPRLTLYLALIKFERFEWAVEKATELGVTRIVPVEANRSEHGLFAGAQKRAERWKRIARESSEQSRRMRMPEVGDPIRLPEALNDSSTHRCWLDEQPGARPLLTAFAVHSGDSAALLIGPEGGWIDAERRQFSDAGWTAASLGPSVLRAETAVCAALGVLSQLWLVADAGGNRPHQLNDSKTGAIFGSRGTTQKRRPRSTFKPTIPDSARPAGTSRRCDYARATVRGDLERRDVCRFRAWVECGDEQAPAIAERFGREPQVH